MLTLQIKEKEIENLTPEEEFVRGTVGAKCQINFDEFWQSYNKYIVFKKVGYEPINFMVDTLENEIEIPYTILAESGEFKIGVFGTTETETLPTLYSKDIKILYGTDTHGTTPPTYIPSEIDQLRLSKQDKLVSGENIKTINGNSILGSGNITIEGGSDVEVDQIYSPTSENAQSGKAVAEAVSTEQKRADNTFANALKGSKSGSAILIDDISPVTHEMSVKISSDTVADLTAVKVKRCGKNLLSISNREIITNPYSPNTDVRNFNGNQLFIGITANNYFITHMIKSYSIGETITVKSEQSAYGLGYDVAVEPNTSYVFSSITTNGEIRAGLYNKDGTFSRMISEVSTFTTNSTEYWAVIILKQPDYNESIEASFSNIQLKLGTTATDYEPYITPTEYTPTADGTVNGVSSLYPNTTLMTDTDGVTIDCEYNRDINKAFAALEAAIVTNS